MNAPIGSGESAKPAWNNGSVDTVDKVNDALEHLGLERLSQDAVQAISASPQRAEFKKALEACLGIGGATASQQTKEYLCGMAGCVSPTVLQTLAQLGYGDAPFVALISIGQSNGIELRSAVRVFQNAGEQERQEAEARIHGFVGKCITRSAAKDNLEGGHDSAPGSEHHDATVAGLPPGEYRSAHVYGASGALCFNAARSRRDEHVVVIDAASGSQETARNWANAIHFQVGVRELPILYGVFEGWRDTVKFERHGDGRGKSLVATRQEGKIFVRVEAKGGHGCAVPITELDAFAVTTLIFAQIMRQVPDELKGQPELVRRMMRATQNIAPLGAGEKRT